MKPKWNCAAFCSLLLVTFLAGETVGVSSQDAPAPAPFSAPTSQEPSPLKQLVWETDHKTMTPKEMQLTADFSFAFTNASDSEVVIDYVKPSCSCTTAKLPPMPWHIAPHTNGEIGVSVDLKNKMGEFEKTINVFFAARETPPKVLTVKIKMPDRNAMRSRNMQLAQVDRQAVFKGDCAKCHAEPARSETGMALYREICGICHEARPRASMVPDLRLLPHPTDVEFWKTSIANGKPGTLMPAFAASQGGPLTDEQIDDLAKAIDQAFPYARFNGHPPQPQTNGTVNLGGPSLPSLPSKN